MDSNATILYRNKQEWAALLVFVLLVGGGVIALGVTFRDAKVHPDLAPVLPYVFVGVELLCLFGGVFAIRYLLDNEPKLVIDEHGIEDHRTSDGPNFIHWMAIQSLDYEVTQVNGSLRTARVTLYVVSSNDTIEQVRVDLADLNMWPRTIAEIIKKEWIQFNYREKRALDLGEE